MLVSTRSLEDLVGGPSPLYDKSGNLYHQDPGTLGRNDIGILCW